MNEVLKTIMERRSIREYQNKQISKSQLASILNAGTFAASGMGQQASMLVAVQDPFIIAQMSGLNADVMGMDIDPFYGAPTVVVVFADSARLTYIEDGSLVIGNMMLAAAAVGVDSCWVHRARETFETEEGKELKKQWGIPENYVGVGNCILGYRTGDLPEAAKRKTGRIIHIGAQ